jgi:ferredoxin
MRGFVDKDTCIGCGLCPTICPEIFEMEDDGKAAAKNIDIESEILSQAQEAERDCPVNAITVE